MKKLFRRFFPNKASRAYRKMHRKHRREMVKLAKKVREWDYSWLDELVHIQIKHMHEYFSAGNNVWQTDETRVPIVEQLKHVLDLYDEMDTLWDNYESNLIENENGSVTVADEGGKKYLTIRNREKELYGEIYSYIGKYIQWWWD